MTQHYRLTHPGVTSISVDGVEHKVNPNSGLLEVEVRTPGLEAELASRGAVLTDPGAEAQRLTPDQEIERNRLFDELDRRLGRRIDRRRSLQQLRELKSDLDDADRARSAAPGAASSAGGDTAVAVAVTGEGAGAGATPPGETTGRGKKG